MLIKRVQKGVTGIERALVPAAEGFFSQNPAVFEFLTAEQWEDGTRRTPGTVNVFFEDGRVKAFVNDKDSDRSVCVSASSWEDLWTVIESGLMSGSLDWRRRPSRGGGKKS